MLLPKFVIVGSKCSCKASYVFEGVCAACVTNTDV